MTVPAHILGWTYYTAAIFAGRRTMAITFWRPSLDEARAHALRAANEWADECGHKRRGVESVAAA